MPYRGGHWLDKLGKVLCAVCFLARTALAGAASQPWEISNFFVSLCRISHAAVPLISWSQICVGLSHLAAALGVPSEKRLFLRGCRPNAEEFAGAPAIPDFNDFIATGSSCLYAHIRTGGIDAASQ